LDLRALMIRRFQLLRSMKMIPRCCSSRVEQLVDRKLHAFRTATSSTSQVPPRSQAPLELCLHHNQRQ
jgi:hypothetical protein